MSRFKDAYGRFVPQREWELVAFGLATVTLGSIPVAWFLHGFSTVREPWNVLPVTAALVLLGRWLRRKRLVSNQPVLPNRNDS